MTELAPILSRLGLEQYLEVFIEEGFDIWEVVLDITESDLYTLSSIFPGILADFMIDALGVRLGHRRKLQREIANQRGFNVERLLTSPTLSLEDSHGCGLDEKANIGKTAGKSQGNIGGKRKYRRHPKPDENAPERPPSAYVIFSNKIREELRPQNLSFTEIAKRVGESWQVLLADEKEPYESQASSAKEKYHEEMTEYKKNDEYRDYSKYLADFKIRNASASDGKRLRLEKEASVASSGSTGSQGDYTEALPSGIISSRRLDPFGSMGSYSLGNEHLSPSSVAITMAPPHLFGSHSSTLRPGSPDPISPLTNHRGESVTISNLQASSKIHVSNEYIFDKSSESTKGRSLPRIIPLKSHDPRIPSSNNHTFLNDPKVLRSRNSSPPKFQRANRPSAALPHYEASMSSSSSSMSSNLSGSIATPVSIYTPTTTIEDIRSQRSLPPLSIAGPTHMTSPSYVEPNGQSNHASVSNQSSSFILPMSQSPSFASPSSPGIPSEQALHHRSLSREAQDTPKPQSRPFLPKPSQVASDKDQRLVTKDDSPGPFPSSQADPLSVLAYAGRMVDRGAR